MTSIPAIIIPAYNRPASLERLLSSLDKVECPGPVPLVISIDGAAANPETVAAARRFVWRHGNKEIVCQSERLGLREHILRCGDLSRQYGAVLILEDDLYVSPGLVTYALAALAEYGAAASIAGISLYAPAMNETAQVPFCALADGSDVFFARYPSSCGQGWTCGQWNGFRAWYDHGRQEGRPLNPALPPDVLAWPDSSWKRHFLDYMVANDLYFVYPRVSLTTNCGDAGTHFAAAHGEFQVPLLWGPGQDRFRALPDSNCVYDEYWELLPSRLARLNPAFAMDGLLVDLHGRKPLGRFPHARRVLTVKPCRQAQASYGRELKPIELNVIREMPGSVLHLADVADVAGATQPWTADDYGFYYGLTPGAAAMMRRADSMRSSLSWRLTAPLRSAGRWVRWPGAASK